jgi:hypothetical protein
LSTWSARRRIRGRLDVQLRHSLEFRTAAGSAAPTTTSGGGDKRRHPPDDLVQPLPAGGCPRVLVLVRVETTKPDPVTLTVVIQGALGPRTYTATLSGATSYQVTLPGSGQQPYLQSEACAATRSPPVIATATPAAPNPDTHSLSCP